MSPSPGTGRPPPASQRLHTRRQGQAETTRRNSRSLTLTHTHSHTVTRTHTHSHTHSLTLTHSHSLALTHSLTRSLQAAERPPHALSLRLRVSGARAARGPGCERGSALVKRGRRKSVETRPWVPWLPPAPHPEHPAPGSVHSQPPAPTAGLERPLSLGLGALPASPSVTSVSRLLPVPPSPARTPSPLWGRRGLLVGSDWPGLLAVPC